MSPAPQFLHARSASLYPDLVHGFDAIIAHYKSLAKDGWTLAEIWEMTQSATASFIKLVQSVDASLATASLKEIVLAAAADFYDQVIAPIDIPHIPNFIETRFVDPKVKEIFLKLVTGAVDSLNKVFGRELTTVTPPPASGTPHPALPSGFVPY